MWVQKPEDTDLRELFEVIIADIDAYDKSITSITKDFRKELKNYESIKNPTAEANNAKTQFILKHQREVAEAKKVVIKTIIEKATDKLEHVKKVYK